jgi:uncharacterized peroxidase-related enzyme
MFVSAPEPSEATARHFEANAKEMGFVMNLARAWAWRPEVFEGFAALRGQLTSNSTLAKRDLAVIVCATAAALGDSYCALAWGRILTQEAGAAAAAAVITETQVATLNARDRALAAWARKVVSNPNGTTREDVDQLRAAGFTDREVFEATTFIAFRLAFSTVNDALGVQPDWQLLEMSAPEVKQAVNFGRQAGEKPKA